VSSSTARQPPSRAAFPAAVNIGSHAATAQFFGHPHRVDGQPTGGDVTDPAAYPSTVGIANVHVEVSPCILTEVAGVEYPKAESNQVATGRPTFLDDLDHEGKEWV
jgi:hypothetical protein